MLYRVYVEDKTVWYGEDIGASPVRIASTFFPCFTAFKAIGYWRGESERSVVIEVDTSDHATVYEMAREMKIRLEQESVLVVEIPSTSEVV